MSAFDLVADRFERYRALPSHVPGAICQAMHLHGGISAAARLLEVGCGTGRIGAQFGTAYHNYFGLDLSIAMLRRFERKASARRLNLVHADGGLLPFGDRVFDAVLMVHLLTARNWRVLLAEAHRVLRSGGMLGIGKIAPRGSSFFGSRARPDLLHFPPLYARPHVVHWRNGPSATSAR
jgi:ubiquinone/menaquinone biosynthesis C-methylase UbiE